MSNLTLKDIKGKYLWEYEDSPYDIVDGKIIKTDDSVEEHDSNKDDSVKQSDKLK